MTSSNVVAVRTVGCPMAGLVEGVHCHRSPKISPQTLVFHGPELPCIAASGNSQRLATLYSKDRFVPTYTVIAGFTFPAGADPKQTLDGWGRDVDWISRNNESGHDHSKSSERNALRHCRAGADLLSRRGICGAGGIDMLHVSQISRGSNIDLRPGSYSDIDYFKIADQGAAAIA